MSPRRLYRAVFDGAVRFVVEEDGECRLVEGDPFGVWQGGRAVSVDPARWLAPIDPGKIVGIGRNYRDHAAERAKPVRRDDPDAGRRHRDRDPGRHRPAGAG